MQHIHLVVAGLFCASFAWAAEDAKQPAEPAPKKTGTDWSEIKPFAETSWSSSVINGLAADRDKTAASPPSQYLGQAAPAAKTLPPVAAEKAAADSPTVVLDTMVVSGASIGRGSNVANMDVSTTILTREQIRKSPQIFLDQMINKELGVWTSQVPANQLDPTAAVVSIRGFGASGGEKVLVMVDGVPINDGYFRTIDWNMIPRDTIEKIEIVRGGGAATLWGNLAAGGVINIITREPEKGELRVGGGYGSFDTKVGSAAATLFHNDTVKVGVNLNTIYSGGYNLTPENLRNQFTVPTASHTNNALISTYINPWEGAKFYVKLNAHELIQSGVGLSGATNAWYKYDYRGGGQIKYSNTGSVNVNSFFNYSEMNKHNASLVGLNILKPETSQTATQAVSQVESMPYLSYGGSTYLQERMHGAWGTLRDIKVGVDVRGISVSDHNTIYSGKGFGLGGGYQFAAIDIAGKNMFEGLFAQATYNPFDMPLDITLGLRQDWWQSYSGNIAQTIYNAPVAGDRDGFNHGTVRTSGQLRANNQIFAQFNPRLGLKYSFENGIQLRGAVYRNFAAPGMNQLFRTYVSSSSATVGNPSLAPETNFGQEVGIDFIGEKIKTKVTFFHNQLGNYINRVNVCSNNPGYATCDAATLAAFGLAGSGLLTITNNQNIGSAVIEGGEASIEWQALETLNLNFGIIRTIGYLSSFSPDFAALNASVVAQGNTPLQVGHKQLPFVQPWTINAGGTWLILPNLQFTFVIRSWPVYYSDTQHLVGQRLSAATTADVSLNYQMSKRVSLYFTAQNLSDKRYLATNYGTSTATLPTLGMPLNVMGGINLSF